MHINYEGKTRSYNFGIDFLNGVFLNVFDENGHPRINFSEFVSFHIQLNLRELNFAVEQGEIHPEDFGEIMNYPIGDFCIYFENLMPKSLNVTWPEEFDIYEKSGNPGIPVTTLKTYIDYVQKIKDSNMQFERVTWLDLKSNKILYTIDNDQFVEVKPLVELSRITYWGESEEGFWKMNKIFETAAEHEVLLEISKIDGYEDHDITPLDHNLKVGETIILKDGQSKLITVNSIGNNTVTAENAKQLILNGDVSKFSYTEENETYFCNCC